MGTPIRTVVDDYLVSLEESGLSAATVSSYRTDLNRLVRVSETLQATAEDVLEAVGDPATTPLGRRRRRYDTINRFFKSDVVRALGIPNPCNALPRPCKEDLVSPANFVAWTREAADRYLEVLRKGGSPKTTINNYKRSLYRLVDVAPTLPADDDQIYEALGDPEEFKPNTRRQRYAALSTFFTSKTAKDLGLTNPMPGITRPPKGKPLIRVYTRPELRALYEAVETPQEKALLLFMLNTGVRVGEVEGLKVEHISEGYITVDGKTDVRTVPISPKMEEILRELASPAGDIWWDEKGPLSKAQISYRYRRLARRAGIKGAKIGPHTLRHTFATWWLRNGGGIVQLQKILGHTELKTTEMYLHLVQEDVERDQEQYSLTASMHLFGGLTTIRCSEETGDRNSDTAGPQNNAGGLLFIHPEAWMAAQHQMEEQARLAAAAEYLKGVECLELQGGRPNKVLPRQVAELILLDWKEGHTLSAVARKYGTVCGFSRTWLKARLEDGSLERMAKTDPKTGS